MLVLSTESARAQALAKCAGELLGDRLAGFFSDCIEQVPVAHAEAARAARQVRPSADGVVAVGGGSTIGHGKAIKLLRDVKLIHVVTTYSGSEMTISQGFLENDGVKRHVEDQSHAARTA